MGFILSDWFLLVLRPFDCVVKFQSLAQFPVDHLFHLVYPCFPFCSSWQHQLIMQLTVFALSPRNLHLLFCCVLSISALTWRCFVLLLEEILCLSWGFPFVAMSRCFREYFRQFVTWNFHTFVFLLIFCFYGFAVFLSDLILPVLILAAEINLSLLFLTYS